MKRQDEIKMKDAVSNRSVKDLTADIIEIKSTDERSSLRHLQAGFVDQFEPNFKKHKSRFKTAEQTPESHFKHCIKVNVENDETLEYIRSDQEEVLDKDEGITKNKMTREEGLVR